MDEVKGGRIYSSPLRVSQAAGTRQLVLRAAAELFVAQGYAATTMDHIAERAGVSRPTVFRAVGNKQMLLRAVRDVAIAGDDEPVPVARRPVVDAIRAEPDRLRAIELLAQHLTAVAGRYGPIYEVLRAAARSGEPDLLPVWEAEEQERLVGARVWMKILRAKGGTLRAGVDAATATDQLWLLMAPDHFERLVHWRGWSTEQYRRWLAASISQLFVRGR